MLDQSLLLALWYGLLFNIFSFPLKLFYICNLSLTRQTWKDAEMLAELFENFKENTLTDPACAKARAPGHEIISSKTGGPVVGASAQNNVVNARTGKQKWICACCKNQVAGPFPSLT